MDFPAPITLAFSPHTLDPSSLFQLKSGDKSREMHMIEVGGVTTSVVNLLSRHMTKTHGDMAMRSREEASAGTKREL